MEAGPRDTAQGTERATTGRGEPERHDDGRPSPDGEGRVIADDHGRFVADGEGPDDLDAETRPGADGEGLGFDGVHHSGAGSNGRPVPDPDGGLGPDALDETPDGVTDDGPEPDEMFVSGPEVEVELRPQRRLRLWQLAPIVGLAAVGSLMFAFPLAFDFGDSGAVIAMLGLLICSCAAGWGMMAARKVGHTWPGLPQRGSGRRPDWRVVLAYVVVVAAVVVLAVWRVARLR
ncbi:hypothetical protein [Streptomyces chromofuscus]|uniref:Transmembrane protein n=1 Tax=Streptomyces chromofuscus TaxID=42881 RepID=A0A7M2THU3_STRCW|nr:hypothetical protein IPT68_27465 [Streptomyces chromofuscus]